MENENHKSRRTFILGKVWFGSTAGLTSAVKRKVVSVIAMPTAIGAMYAVLIKTNGASAADWVIQSVTTVVGNFLR